MKTSTIIDLEVLSGVLLVVMQAHVKTLLLAILTVFLLHPVSVLAHPGRTDSSGGHTCRTNCPSWGYSYGSYHYHGGYSAPTTPTVSTGTVLGTTTYISNYIYKYSDDIPGIVNEEFKKVFGRLPRPDESYYWKGRVRSTGYDSIDTRSELRETMGWHKSNGSTGSSSGFSQQVAGAKDTNVAAKINAIFRSVYDRNPTPSENQYWLSRIKDKPTEQALKDAMSFHKANGITH